ncbi:cytochrome c [Antarctobacter sp.]|uniref:c-type cytochrome n=1 Tax=Antarctobacter sp. TaxID=1872577 RepID=UPI002B273B1C|nr:cytochrome c [Antarctobacter sp.]
MKTRYILAGTLALGAAIAAYQFTSFGSADAQTAPAVGAPLVQVIVPETLSPDAQIGKTGFDAICAACHGQNAAGRNGKGPPLVHKIYEPSHHGDESFQLAVQRGVRAHHWPFGNMPPVAGLTRADVVAIVAYVRELQRANGIN